MVLLFLADPKSNPSFTFFLENEEKNFSDLNKLHLFKKKDEIKFFKMSSKNFDFDDLKK